MRVRFWMLLAALALLSLTAVSCARGVAPALPNTPVPVKTLRPTFTATVERPAATATPEAAEPTAEVVKPTEAPTSAPTEAPTPTPEAAAFSVNSATLNVRSGPGTNFAVIGRLNRGQEFPVTGRNEDGSWWEFDYEGKSGWVTAANVTVTGADAVQVAANIPQPPTAAPRPTARPVAQQPAPRPAQPQPAPQPQPQPQPAPATSKYAVNGTGRRPDTNDWVTVYCIVYDRSGNGLLPGTLRVTRDGQVVGTATFTQFPTYYLESGYNAGCKAEIRPAANGNYTAVLVEGDAVVSDPISFTVTGEGDRINFVAWKQR